MRAPTTRSLRFKLALWFWLAFLLIEALVVGGSISFRRDAIGPALDAELESGAQAMVENIVVTGAELDADELLPLVPAGLDVVFFALRRPDRTESARWNVPEGTSVPLSEWEIVPAGPVGPVIREIGPARATELTGDARPLRMITLPFRYRDELHYLQIAVREAPLVRHLGPFLGLVLIGVPIGLGVAWLAAWFIGGRAVRPFEHLSRAAQDVSPESLDERFRTATSHVEVQRLERELNSALERLQVGYDAQREFIANVSHELKTPISVLLTEAQVAALEGRDEDAAFVRRVEHEMRRLGRLVESLLVLARAELEVDRPDDVVSMRDVVVEAVRRTGPLAEARRVRLVVQLDGFEQEDVDDPLVEGDADLLEAMVENLLRNAVRFSPSGEPVDVAVSRSDDSLEIVVRDQGPGVPPEDRERVFERFGRGAAAAQGEPGSGLGLTIAQRVARLHGGRLRLLETERGAAFAIELPLASGAAEARG